MKRILLAAAVAAAGLIPAASSAAPPARGEERVNALIVYGSDPCPRGEGDDIVVCARKPESERYRIPPSLRGDPNDPANQAWGARAESLEYVGRTGIGSCSPVGPGGFTGCFNQIVREARADRGQSDVNMVRMIEQARDDRNKRIDAEQAAESAEHPVTPPK
ncbi:MAG: hypothetical protein JWO81_338 [Alphaproteobacteria bacterium]|nr:hypothetical protein [Alphaproteobacteria bacterium]